MFGVLTVERKKPGGLWESLRLRFCPRSAIRCETDSVRMALFLKVSLTLPEKAGPRLVRGRPRRCMSLMRQRGVHRAVVPEQAREAAADACIAPVDRKAAVQGCAAEAVLLALRAAGLEPEQSGVTLIADRTGRDVQTAALMLARRVRCVRVRSRVPAPALRRRLYEDYGIAENPPLEDTCTAALVFDKTDEPLDAYGIVCNLTDGPLGADCVAECRYGLTCAPSVLAQKPPQVDESDFVAALYLCGGLTLSDLILRIDPECALDIEENPSYNKD